MQWADALVWSSALSNPEVAADLALRGKLFHTHMVQRAFLSVWQAGSPGSPPTDPPDLPTTLELARSYYSELTPFLDALDERELERPVALPWAGRFAQRLGREPATTTLADTILQVAMHSAYHRGQVNTRLREVGVEPPLTDYIAWVWFGRPEPRWPPLSA
ncbi:MAG TPA: DinB family protein [Pyrinomonadaceae bacterium]|nr:DinB family protein [Pyrinomonadaceae bacterium]